MKFFFVLFFNCWFIGLFAQTHSLAITIPNLNSKEGEIQIGIYNEKKAFPIVDRHYKVIIIAADMLLRKYIIHDLPEGDYSVAIFHDENKDKICNSIFLGIPNEGYGFSTNYKPKFSAPTFDDCKITLDHDMSIEITIIY
jgi:uncharacterized protein (DUF2141 family)